MKRIKFNLLLSFMLTILLSVNVSATNLETNTEDATRFQIEKTNCCSNTFEDDYEYIINEYGEFYVDKDLNYFYIDYEGNVYYVTNVGQVYYIDADENFILIADYSNQNEPVFPEYQQQYNYDYYTDDDIFSGDSFSNYSFYYDDNSDLDSDYYDYEVHDPWSEYYQRKIDSGLMSPRY